MNYLTHLTRCLAIIFFLLQIKNGEATHYLPWLGTSLEFDWQTSLLYQSYHSLSSGNHGVKYPSNDFFLQTSLSNSYDVYGIELEAVAARTRRQRGDVDHLRLTGRYVVQDDVAGDPYSLTVGLGLIQAFQYSVKDVSSFHHGRGEAELFISIGKEFPLETSWYSRWWAIGGIGGAERGSCWLRFDLAYEGRWRERHEVRVFMNSLWGLGNQDLCRHHFHGYGSIRHQSIDIGCRYTYLLDYFGNVSFCYSYRPYAYNFPAYAHHLWVEIAYTFGL